MLEKPKENDFGKMLKCWICAQKSPIYPILHIISVLFTNATSYRIVFRFVSQYYMIWSEHTFLSTVMCFWWKKQPFEKNTRESTAIVIAKKYRKNQNWFLLDRWWNTVAFFIGSPIQMLIWIWRNELGVDTFEIWNMNECKK